ncbi:hypothetical protein DUI87_11727 [Hirundo rustica rustica]|uniref:Uncharacterized protein n=1 Tax=Hirundo rustica rustica TaxID=333673 RepID=A0A3M0KEN9_HIRRU|nr:hypothetical protein DUI87_11727 [Hirundo rustica rustica]
MMRQRQCRQVPREDGGFRLPRTLMGEVLSVPKAGTGDEDQKQEEDPAAMIYKDETSPQKNIPLLKEQGNEVREEKKKKKREEKKRREEKREEKRREEKRREEKRREEKRREEKRREEREEKRREREEKRRRMVKIARNSEMSKTQVKDEAHDLIEETSVI